ncbi:hypothetical protein C8R46DRAFT_468215 [Mycena filopes]|nr:hypothetical protein C8R46DRAFT_468215 [Mycena filopes]
MVQPNFIFCLALSIFSSAVDRTLAHGSSFVSAPRPRRPNLGHPPSGQRSWECWASTSMSPPHSVVHSRELRTSARLAQYADLWACFLAATTPQFPNLLPDNEFRI